VAHPEALVGPPGEGVGDDDLLDETDDENGDAKVEVRGIEPAGEFASELGDHFSVMDDGACNQLREEQDEQRIGNERGLGDLLAVGVDQERDLLERDERYAKRQEDLFEACPDVDPGIQIVDEKIEVLEIREGEEVCGDTDGEQTLGGTRGMSVAQAAADDVVETDRAHEQEHVDGVPEGVERDGCSDEPELGCYRVGRSGKQAMAQPDGG
jgi:hypothetical protein